MTETLTGYTFHHPRPEDMGSTYELIRAIQIADEGECDFTEEDMQVVWRTGKPENMWLVEAEDGSLAAYAGVRQRHPTRLRTFSGVLPEHRGNGIGTQLLGLVEERARRLAAKAPEGEIVMLSHDVGALNSDKAALLEHHGYELVRTFLKMGIELDEEPPEPQLPDGIVLETMRPGTEREIYDASEEAFRDHWDHVPHDYDEWREWNFSRESFDPTLWLVAYDGDEIAGISLNHFDGGDEAWVNVLAVRRPWRRHGLGLALLLTSFRDFRRRGIARAALGVDSENPTGATRLYERAGMHVVREEKAYAKEIPRA
jgi:mycothiol synthase